MNDPGVGSAARRTPWARLISPSSGGGWPRWLPVLLLGAALLSVYAGKLSGPFVFDDEQAIEGNQSIRALWPPGPVLQPPRDTPVAGRPVANLLFAINYALTGPDPFGFHLFNLGLHLLAALLLQAVLRRLFAAERLPPWVRRRARELSTIAALLWSVHPLTVEVVLYTSQRTESCMAVCYLLTIYAVLRVAGVPHPRARRPGVALWSLVAVGACALGMASKAVMVTAPVLIFFLDRAFVSGSFAETLRRRRFLYAGLASTWSVLLLLELGAPRARSVRLWDADYLLVQGRVIAEYLALSVWPHRAVPDFGPLLPVQAAPHWPAAAVVAALALASAVLAFTHPRAGFAGAWVFGVLAPTSSIVAIYTEIGAERRMYLPLAALIACAVVLVYGGWLRLLQSARIARRALLLPAAAAGLALGAQSRGAADHYRSTLSYWQQAVRARPDNPRAHYNLAETHRRAGRLEQAIAGYRLAIWLREDYAEAYVNVGVALSASGRAAMGLDYLQRGVALSPGSAKAQYNLGVAMAMAGRLREAESAFQQALDVDPGNAPTRAALSRVRARLAEPASPRAPPRSAVAGQ